MKKLYLSLFASLLVLAVSAQLNEFGIGYQLSLPRMEMKDGWNAGHGFQMTYYRQLNKAKWLNLGANLGFGTYATETQEQEYLFRDGTITNTDVILSSSLGNAALSARVSPLAGKKIMPFIELQGGYFWMFSKLYIEDPADPLGCKALENKNLVQSGTMFASAGAGVQILLANGKRDSQHFLEISARSIFGNSLEYANMNRTYHDHEVTSDPLPDPVKGEKPLQVTFINVSTNEQHDHTVAELYDHPLRVLQFNILYTYKFSRLF